jgi:SAM-dependent methyltransferase
MKIIPILFNKKIDTIRSIAINQGLKGIVHLALRRVFLRDRITRRKLASKYLSGDGIEIGALHSPLKVPSAAKVRYVDRMSVADLRKQYPELSRCKLVEVDIIDNGENLTSIDDNSLDFVIANHMIEHCQEPIGTMQQFLRVLKPGGVLYMAVPDKRYTFDFDRPLTTIEHLVRDYRDGAVLSKIQHSEEWCRLVQKVPDAEISSSVNNLISMDYSIHFHVWTKEEFIKLLQYCEETLQFPFKTEIVKKNYNEFIVILRKI